jgi:hypothetical protein
MINKTRKMKMTEYIITLSNVTVDRKTSEDLDDGTIDEKTFLIEAVQNGSITIQMIERE